jgi:dinuclear metal center YbgI/SA1388 family protein
MTESRLPTVADVARAIEEWAPPGSAQPYDNVGLQVGRRDRAVRRAVVALDCTPGVVRQAKDLGAELVVSHHPLLFRPARSVTGGDLVGATVLALAESGIALYSAHTNLDSARDGVSFALARQIGLEGVRFLQPLGGDVLSKLVVFVPGSHAEAVRTALADAGAGRIGAYDGCAFESRGTGHFRPTDDADPFIGRAGGPAEQVEEVRLETEVASWRLDTVLAAMREAHPYEEVAYDVVPVRQPYRCAGLGAIGTLPAAEPLYAFLSRVAERLGVRSLRHTGAASDAVRTVAVCGGSGSDLIPVAIAAGADAYVTADVTYHRFFDALGPDGSPRLMLVDAGHWETEAVAERILRDYLAARFDAVDWHLASAPTTPVRTFLH